MTRSHLCEVVGGITVKNHTAYLPVHPDEKDTTNEGKSGIKGAAIAREAGVHEWVIPAIRMEVATFFWGNISRLRQHPNIGRHLLLRTYYGQQVKIW